MIREIMNSDRGGGGGGSFVGATGRAVNFLRGNSFQKGTSTLRSGQRAAGVGNNNMNIIKIDVTPTTDIWR